MPGKNIRKLKDKPLIAYSVEQAKSSEYIDRVIVSTDDLKIADIARQYGAEVPFIRPANLAADNSSTIDVLLHVIDWLGESANYLFDILVLLHVTTPLRTVEDIDNCIELLVRENADNVFSVAAAYRNPYFNMVEVTKDGSVSLVKKGDFTTRQSAPKVYDMNASIYVWWKDILKAQKSVFLEKSRVYVMPRERSVDIDDLMDFKIAEMLLKGLVA